MSDHGISVDCIYVAASTNDARFTRICVVSIRYFYPEVPIRLLAGGPLQPGLAEELNRYWNVEMAILAGKGDYGWGFVKLEPLFGRLGEKFLVLDSDTVLTGPVLHAWADSHAPFLVDDEKQSEADTKRLYYDWERVRKLDPCARPPRFVFNTGQWFGTAGVLTRPDFAPWIEWTTPRKTVPPALFMNGDQGVLNYIFNRKVALGDLQVERRQIMRWPGHSMEGLDAETVANGGAPPLVVHWAGLKKARQRDMAGADLLAFFEKLYYERLPAGSARRLLASYQDLSSYYARSARARIRLASRKLALLRGGSGSV